MIAIHDIDERNADKTITGDPHGEQRVLFRWWHRDYVVADELVAIPAGGAVLPRTVIEPVPAAIAHADQQFRLDSSSRYKVDASIVICTRDRPTELARCLASLPQQTVIPREIIVVDNASVTDATRDAALAAGVTYVREDRPGLDFARNAGGQSAVGKIVVYTDDDVILHPRWLERIVRAFDASDIAAVTGLVMAAELATEAQEVFEFQWGFARGFERIDFKQEFFARDRIDGAPVWDIGAGASMAFRRDALAQIGWFDVRLDVGAAGCSGDSEVWYRLLSFGHACRYEPGAMAFHFHRRDFAGLRKQIRAYMRGHVAALLVQYEYTQSAGLQRRLWRSLPRYYFDLLRRRLRSGPEHGTMLLRQMIVGHLAGLWFYARNRRVVGRT